MIPPDLQSQMLRMLDGELSAGELAALEAELEENPAAREAWQKLSRVHSGLEVRYESQANVAKLPVVPIDRVLARQRRRVVKTSLLAAAAVLLISGVALWLNMVPNPPASLAGFRTAPNSVFMLSHTGDGEAPMGNVLAEGSKVVLEHGVAELNLPNEVLAVVEAPAAITLLDERTLQLDHGRAFFEVSSEEGKGFTVITRHQQIVDLGTAFGIDSRSDRDKVELHVFEGRVRVDHLDGTKGKTFTATRSVLLSGARVERDLDGPPASFRRKLPAKVETLLLEDFESGLLAGRDYSVRIDPTVITDLAGNPFRGINDDTTWDFTTAAVSTALVASDMNEGGTDTGFDGGFYEGSRHVLMTDAPDLAYANYGITQTGTTQRVYVSNAAADRQDRRDLATAMTGSIWFSVLVKVPAGSQYAGLTFNGHGETYDPITTDARILMGPGQLQVGLNRRANTPGAGTFAPDTTHLLLGQMKVGAGNDTLNVWVDPDLTAASNPNELPAANFTSSTVDFADSIINLGVAGRSGGGTSDVSIDAIRLSNTATAFSDVTGVKANAIDVSSESPDAFDTVPPSIAHLDSTPEGDDKLRITFNEPVQRGAGGIVIREAPEAAIIETIPVSSAQLAIRHSELTIRPTHDLGTGCSVEITAGAVEDLAGNPFPGITGKTARSFHRETPTAAPSTSIDDDTPPVLVSLRPGDNTLGAAPGSLLEMTFDEPIKLGTGRFFIRNATDWIESELVVGDPRISADGRVLTITPPAGLPDGSISMKWVGNWGSDASAGLLNPAGDGTWYSHHALRDKGRGRGTIGSMRGPLMATFRQPQPSSRIRHELAPIAPDSRYTVTTAIGVRDTKAAEKAAFLGYTIRLVSGDTVLAELTDDTPPGPPNSITSVGFSWDSSSLPKGVEPGHPLAIEIAPIQTASPDPGYLDLDNVRVTVVGE